MCSRGASDVTYRKVNILIAVILLVGFSAYSMLWESPFYPLVGHSTGGRVAAEGKPLQAGQGIGVSAAHPEAVAAGMKILREGGNAVDAAIAVSFALGVVQPFDCGIGGGGAMLIYPGDGSPPVVYEYREKAPLSGKMTDGKVGLPGFVRGMEALHMDFGSREWADLLAPAISLAEAGFTVSPHLTRHVHMYRQQLPVAALPHFFPQGQTLRPGQKLIQTELAATLQTISNEGADAFYAGEIAEDIIAKIPQFTLDDFHAYQTKVSPPVRSTIYGFEVLVPGPPLGGMTLIQTLQMMEMAGENLAQASGADYYSLLANIFRETGSVWQSSVADPAYAHVPVPRLTSREYAWDLLQKAIRGDSTPFVEDELDDGNTTHFVVLDASGMMVSATHTISSHFGSGIYVDGFFLNNQLRNFSVAPGSINNLQPGKSPRGTIAPAILIRQGEKMIGIGAPGGSRIPMILAQVIHHYIALDMDLAKALAMPRMYALNGLVYLDDRIPAGEREALRARGFAIYGFNKQNFFDGVHCIVVDYATQQIHGGGEPGTDSAWSVEPCGQ